MMLVTKCPNCHTVFKVVSDQLKISEGWVRCGQCDEIFDTTLNVREWDPAKPEDNVPPSIVTHEEAAAARWQSAHAAPVEEASVTPQALSMASEPQAPKAAPAPDVFDEYALTKERPFVEIEPDFEPAVGQEPKAIEPTLDPFPIDFAPEPEPVAEPVPAFPRNVAEEYVPEPSEPLFSEVVEPEEMRSPPDDEPAAGRAFLEGAKSGDSANALWSRPGVRRFLGFVVGVMALLLFGQFVVTERDRIATVVPGLRPLLEDVCKGIGCKVRPLKQIESMTVESSSFNRFKGETYRLTFVIRNTSDLELARPGLELTLTDSQDQAVYRRVLLPAEFDAKAATMARGEEW